MPNLGEEICGEYLKYILKCEFITYNVKIPSVQGEIDVVGINLEKKLIYVCEVAVHTSGLGYSRNNQPDDYGRFVAKFQKDIGYAKKYFPDYLIQPMIWSPIVKISGQKAKYNTATELERVVQYIQNEHQLSLDLVINESFHAAIEKLKEYTDTETSEFKSSVMRMFQIQRNLEKHLKQLQKKRA